MDSVPPVVIAATIFNEAQKREFGDETRCTDASTVR